MDTLRVAIGLSALACLSPLLTAAWLFQLKEWRLDRFLEHLRREGAWTLPGRTRCLLAVLTTALGFALPATHATVALLAGLTGLAVLSGLPILSGSQRSPDWTRKAILTVLLALVLSAGLLAGLSVVLPLLALAPALMTVPVFLAWALLLPLDWHLKRSIFAAAKARRASLPLLTVVGVVGSVGKTTTKELLKRALSDLSPVVTPAHVNTELGVAQWFLRESRDWKPEEQRLLVVEMGAYRRGEIALLCSVIAPRIGVVTALGGDHLALFGSEEAIVEANAELLAALPADGFAVLYGDNPAAHGLAGRCACAVVTAGAGAENTLRALAVTQAPEGLRFTVEGQAFAVPLQGEHNTGNILLAVAVARQLGVPLPRTAELLKDIHPLPGTFNLRSEAGVTVLDDTYNVSPLSFRAALAWAAARPERPRVLLSAGLLEVGEEEERLLRELGTAAAGNLERAVFTSVTAAAAFGAGFGATAEVLSPATPRVAPGSLLLCVGRLPSRVMPSLLPRS